MTTFTIDREDNITAHGAAVGRETGGRLGRRTPGRDLEQHGGREAGTQVHKPQDGR